MTQHPEELLAAYVDGDIGSAERRAVRSHLRGCERCRGEVEMATRAREALASLSEVEPPPGTAFTVLREARRPPATGRAWRIATAVGVAASLVAGVVVLAQRLDLGGGDGFTADAGQASREAAPEGAAPAQAEAGPDEDAAAARRARRLGAVFVASDMRYASEDMPQVLDRLARRANRVLAGDAATTALSSAAAFNDERAAAAAECSAAAIRAQTDIEDPGVPFVFEQASFYNVHTGMYVPGYVAAFISAPDDEPASLLMAVVDRETCDRLLYYTPPVEL